MVCNQTAEQEKGAKMTKNNVIFTVLVSFLTVLMILLSSAFVQAADVTLAWDANTPTPTGYRLFVRQGPAYDYANPAWQGTATTCTVTVPDDAESAFVVRAYQVGAVTGQEVESGDSNEVSYIPVPASPGNLIIQAINQIIQGLQTLKQAVMVGLSE